MATEQASARVPSAVLEAVWESTQLCFSRAWQVAASPYRMARRFAEHAAVRAHRALAMSVHPLSTETEPEDPELLPELPPDPDEDDEELPLHAAASRRNGMRMSVRMGEP